eukprot:7952502-Pyramimonas_sp.AAC.1
MERRGEAVELRGAFLHLYNTILQREATPPASWKNTVITVIPKSGELAFQQDYRPTYTIQLLHKLVSRVLHTGYNRRLTHTRLTTRRASDQATRPLTTSLHSIYCASEQPNGAKTYGSQHLTFKKLSIQLSTRASGQH